MAQVRVRKAETFCLIFLSKITDQVDKKPGSIEIISRVSVGTDVTGLFLLPDGKIALSAVFFILLGAINELDRLCIHIASSPCVNSL